MKIINSYFSFNDDRGEIKGIINEGEWREINYISSIKGSLRANHFHKKLRELFIIIDGSVNVSYFEVTKPDLIKSKIVTKGDVFIFEKNIFHTFEVIEDAIWINALSNKINPKNPDIHRI
jgi:dTDP-4-dehydrorhamnose 3,5-epimerase-like enzyme